jgi:homocitrate synthase NifV
VNDIREINGLNQYSDLSNVRITGLDSIMCNDYERIFENLKGIFSGSIDLCPENKYHCATAIAVEWVLSGEQNISCSFAGAGGYAALEEILIALRISIRRKPNLDLSFLPEMKKLYEEITNTKIAKNKPILGDEIFTVEAGIHIDGLLKNPIIYEPYDPKIVGAKRTIVAGKHSGRKAIKAMLLKLKIKVLDSSLSCIVKKIQEKSMEYGRSLTNDELIRIANEVNPIEGKKIYN